MEDPQICIDGRRSFEGFSPGWHARAVRHGSHAIGAACFAKSGTWLMQAGVGLLTDLLIYVELNIMMKASGISVLSNNLQNTTKCRRPLRTIPGSSAPRSFPARLRELRYSISDVSHRSSQSLSRSLDRISCVTCITRACRCIGSAFRLYSNKSFRAKICWLVLDLQKSKIGEARVQTNVALSSASITPRCLQELRLNVSVLV